jgi:PTS system mannose-specific IIC component
MHWFEPLMTGIVGGLMALERRAFLQAMLSRPIVAGVATGLLLGDGAAGLFIGLVFELLHLGSASLGGAHPEHEMLPSIASTAFACTMGREHGSDSTPAMWALSILLFAPLGRLGLFAENRFDERARKYFGRAVNATDQGFFDKAARQNLRAMWPHFVFYGLCCAAAAALGPVLSNAQAHFPLGLSRGLSWAYPVIGTVAAGTALHGTHARGRLVIAIIAILATFAWTFSALWSAST